MRQMGFSGFFSGLEGQTQFVATRCHPCCMSTWLGMALEVGRDTLFIPVHTQWKQPGISSFLITDFFFHCRQSAFFPRCSCCEAKSACVSSVN